jgi:hypothetical protein
MQSHIWWTFVCKSKGCKARHDFEYIGVFNSVDLVHSAPQKPTPFQHQCYRCGKTHTYTYFRLNPWARQYPPQ